MKRDFEYSQVAGEDGKKYYDIFRNYVYFQKNIFFLELHFHEYDELNGVSKGHKNISCERSWCPQWKTQWPSQQYRTLHQRMVAGQTGS